MKPSICLCLGICASMLTHAATAPGPASAAASTAASAASTPANKTAPPITRLDLNAATAGELAALPGISAAKAALIIKNRPWDRTESLVHQKLLTNKEYQAIKDRVTVAPASGHRP